MKRFTMLFLLLGIFLANTLLMDAVFAEESGKARQIEEKFKAADKNNDGQLTLEEAKAGMPRVAKGFSKIDTDNKGYVTVDQIKAMSGN